MPATWLVLGGSSAVARAFALAAAEAGDDVLLAGRDLADLRQTAADIRIRTGRAAEAVAFDALDRAAHAGFAAAAARRDGRLDVFLAFGAMPEQAEIDADFELAEATIAATYLGAVSILQHLAPHLAAQGRGHVVVLGSVAGDRGRPSNYVYGSAKAGLHAYLQGLRARLHRHGVSVLTVKPGFTDTAMTWGRPGMFLVNSPEALARRCLRAARRGRDVIYAPWFWRPIMTVIRLVPEPLFKRLRL